MIPSTEITLISGAFAVWLVIYLITRSRKIPKGLRLPPGPPRKLISGNAGDIPTHHEWETYNEWAKQYGSLVYTKVFGQSMVFVNSLDVASDLFEKRSSIYSDRFDFPMLMLMGWDYNMGLMRYGGWWRRHRRALHSKFHPNAATAYQPIQVKQTRDLLRRLHQTPSAFVEHIRQLTGATIIEIIYGFEVLPIGDPYIETAERALAAMSEAGNPGTFLVDTIPILKYVPEWIPGASFRRKARKWREPTVEMSIAPFAAVMKAISDGTAKPSAMASLLEELSLRDDAPTDEDTVIRNVGATAYAAGSDTTTAALHTFMLAMVLYPEAQRKAQIELDAVIGNRLPDFEDRKRLPFINALCKEVNRWHPVFQLGVAHRVMQDDRYGDYFIPGGSVVLGNAWTILHDESVYGPRPREFEPERFLKPGVPDPTAQFGFGRRICVGRYVADNSIFMAVASVLKVFDIFPAKDSNGDDIPVKASFTSGFISRPEPFKCTINPRSPSEENLLQKPAEEQLAS